MVGWERFVLHCPKPPQAVYVNGRKTAAKQRDDTDEYHLSMKAPADIVVILKDPPANLTDLHQATLLRVTEPAAPVDYYRPEALQALADGCLDEQQRPVLQDAAVSPFGFNFGARKHLYVPLAAPADRKGGVFRIHLPVTEKYGQKWNHRIESVELNFQPQALSTSEERGWSPRTARIPAALCPVVMGMHGKGFVCSRCATRLTKAAQPGMMSLASRAKAHFP